MSCRKKTPTELPKLKPNKGLNTRDRANIVKILPTWPKASLFHLYGSSGSLGEVGYLIIRIEVRYSR